MYPTNQFDVSPRLRVFCDRLYEAKPYIAKEPRNHESLFWVTEGALQYTKGGQRAVIPLYHMGYIARESCDSSAPYRCPSVQYIAINFNFDVSSDHPEEASVPALLSFPPVCADGQLHPYAQMMRQCLNTYNYRLPGYELVCRGLVLQIVGLLTQEQQLSGALHRKYLQLSPALTHIQSEFSRGRLCVPELARLCGVSETHLRRLFEQVFGQAPMAYIQTFRIQQAQNLLCCTEEAVGAVALKCGFSDLYGFSHCFKRLVGCSPEEYRLRSKHS